MTRLFARMVGIILVVSLISGCFYVPEDPDEPVAVVFQGDINVSSSGFHMDGYLSTIGSKPEKAVIENINVCLYDENRSLIVTHAIGDLNATSGNVSVSFTSQTTPQYVVIESQDIWEYNFRTHGYVRENNQYNSYDVHSESQRF